LLDSPSVGYALLGLRVISFGFAHPLLKQLNAGKSSVAVATLFCFIGPALMLPFALWQITRPGAAYLTQWQEWLPYVGISGAIFAGAFLLFNWALKHGDVSLISPLTSLTAVFVYLYELVLGESRFDLQAASGIAICVIGAVVLNLRRGEAMPRPAASQGQGMALPLQETRSRPSPVFSVFAVVLFSATIAATRLLDKYAAPCAPQLAYAVLGNIPLLLLGSLILWRRGMLGEPLRIFRERRGLALVTAVSGDAGYLLLLMALVSLRASIVEPVGLLSTLVGVGIGVWRYKEPLHYRLPGALLLIGGASLVVTAG
jgi:drug/metabolite transporter (DMT)-like permease